MQAKPHLNLQSSNRLSIFNQPESENWNFLLPLAPLHSPRIHMQWSMFTQNHKARLHQETHAKSVNVSTIICTVIAQLLLAIPVDSI